jgi:hypothetical protein
VVVTRWLDPAYQATFIAMTASALRRT